MHCWQTLCHQKCMNSVWFTSRQKKNHVRAGPTPACLPACLTRVISSLTTFLQNPQTKGATTEIMSKIFSQFSLVGSKSGPANIFSITTPVLSLTSDSDFWIVEPITQPTQVAEVIAVICGHVVTTMIETNKILFVPAMFIPHVCSDGLRNLLH